MIDLSVFLVTILRTTAVRDQGLRPTPRMTIFRDFQRVGLTIPHHEPPTTLRQIRFFPGAPRSIVSTRGEQSRFVTEFRCTMFR